MTGYYLVLALLIFSVIYCVQLYSSKSLYLKLLSATIAFFISSSIYFTFDSYKGWPSDSLATKGRLVFAKIDPPYKEDKGAIYLLLQHDQEESSVFYKIFHYQLKSPRLHQLPFTVKLEGMVKNAMQKMQEGYIVELEPGVDDDSTEEEGKSKKGSTTEEIDKTRKATERNNVEYVVPHFKITNPMEVLKK